MSVFRFQDFPIYKATREFRKELKSFIKKRFPKEEQFSLISQIFRALDSILFNITEGSQRFSDKDFSRFLNISITSLNEVISGLDAALDDNYISEDEYRYFFQKGENIYRQLKAFASKVRSDS